MKKDPAPDAVLSVSDFSRGFKKIEADFLDPGCRSKTLLIF